MFCWALFEQLLFSFCVTEYRTHIFSVPWWIVSLPFGSGFQHFVLYSFNVVKYLWQSLQCDMVFVFAFARVSSSRTSFFSLSVLLTFLIRASEFLHWVALAASWASTFPQLAVSSAFPLMAQWKFKSIILIFHFFVLSSCSVSSFDNPL